MPPVFPGGSPGRSRGGRSLVKQEIAADGAGCNLMAAVPVCALHAAPLRRWRAIVQGWRNRATTTISRPRRQTAVRFGASARATLALANDRRAARSAAATEPGRPVPPPNGPGRARLRRRPSRRPCAAGATASAARRRSWRSIAQSPSPSIRPDLTDANTPPPGSRIPPAAAPSGSLLAFDVHRAAVRRERRAMPVGGVVAAPGASSRAALESGAERNTVWRARRTASWSPSRRDAAVAATARARGVWLRTPPRRDTCAPPRVIIAKPRRALVSASGRSDPPGLGQRAASRALFRSLASFVVCRTSWPGVCEREGGRAAHGRTEPARRVRRVGGADDERFRWKM